MANELSDPGANAPSPTTNRTANQTAFSTLRLYSDFRLVWVGNFFALSSQWIQILTIGWLVLELTDGNALATGTVIGLRTLPVLLIGPVAGVLADRMDRRKLVMVTQSCMAVIAILFALLVFATDLDTDPISGPLRWWHPFLYMVLAGVAHSIIQPVRQAMVANTVPREALSRALAMSGVLHPTARMLGPALGGLLIAYLGFKWNFLIEAVGYVIIVLLLLPVKLRYRETNRRQHDLSVFRSMWEGLRYVRHDKKILQLITMSMIPNFVFQPLAFVLPIFTTQVLGRGPEAGGILMAAIGIGGIVAGLLIAIFGYGFGKGLSTLLGLVGGCFFILLFAQSHWFLASILTLVGLGFCQYVFRVGNSTLLQISVPDALRGRVMSIYMLDHGITPLAAFLISLYIHFWNASGAFTVIAIVALGLSILQAIFFRAVRQLE